MTYFRERHEALQPGVTFFYPSSFHKRFPEPMFIEIDFLITKMQMQVNRFRNLILDIYKAFMVHNHVRVEPPLVDHCGNIDGGKLSNDIKRDSIFRPLSLQQML